MEVLPHPLPTPNVVRRLGKVGVKAAAWMGEGGIATIGDQKRATRSQNLENVLPAGDDEGREC